VVVAKDVKVYAGIDVDAVVVVGRALATAQNVVHCRNENFTLCECPG